MEAPTPIWYASGEEAFATERCCSRSDWSYDRGPYMGIEE